MDRNPRTSILGPHRIMPAPAAGRWWGAAVGIVAGMLLLAAACNEGSEAASTATPPPPITPPAELSVQRGLVSCYIRQHPAGDIPAVKGYRLAATSLPEGVTPSVKTVHLAGSGESRVLEAEICFTADAGAPSGRHEARLELRLYNADAERLSVNDRLAPVRTLPFTQVLLVR